MSHNWPKVPLGKVLIKSEEWITLDPNKRYKEVKVRLWGKGVILRREVDGVEIASPKRLVVRENQFILSRIDARNGAFGLIPDSLDGAIVTNDFPVFNLDKAQIDPFFLNWMSKTNNFIDLCVAASEGTTNRVRLQEDRFLATPIPLPPLPEQQRIVARIEALAAKIKEAHNFSDKNAKDLDLLLICMAHRNDLDDKNKSQNGWRKIRLEEVLKLVDDSQTVQADKSYPNLGIYSFGRGLFPKPPIDGALTSAKTLRKVKNGQFIYSRLFAFEGAYGMATENFNNCFVSNEYPTFDCNSSNMLVEFVTAYFKSPFVWQEVATGSKGLGDRRQRVQPDKVLTHEIWLPPLKWQDRIAKIQLKVNELEKLQAMTTSELNALLPSILDKAFKGEL
jgi:type I restriction enzyme S subunit